MIAQFIIQSLLLPFVSILGHGDKAVGFQNTMVLFAITGIICLLITFFTTKERITPAKNQESSIKQDFIDLSKNRPWLVMLLVTVLVFITLSLKGGMYVFYFKYYLDPVAQTIFLNDIGFTAFIDHLNSSLTSMGFVSFQWPKDAPTSAFSLFNAGGIIFMIFGIMFSKLLADSFGKRNIYIAFIFLSALSLLLFNFYNRTAIAMVFLTQLLHGFIYGYVAEEVSQIPAAVEGIKLSVSIYPGFIFIISAVLLCFYSIDKKMEIQIETDLKQRREC
jgi:Na+/melibiose symporter-like transporter